MKGVQVVDQSSGEPGDEKVHHGNLSGENDHDVVARSPSEISPSSDPPHRDVDFLEDEITLEQWEAEWGPESTALPQDAGSQSNASSERAEDAESTGAKFQTDFGRQHHGHSHRGDSHGSASRRPVHPMIDPRPERPSKNG